MYLKRVEKKKLLGRHKKVGKYGNSHFRCSIQNIAQFLRAPILKYICKRLLLKLRKMCSWNSEKLKIIHIEL